MQDENCIFCKIVSGVIPCHRLLETDSALAFLDIGPLSPGHALIIPKDHHENILDTPPETMAAVASLIPTLANALKAATGAGGINVLQNTGKVAGQLVDHLHVHLIPRVEGDGLGYRWKPKEYAGGEAEDMAERIVSRIKTA